MKSRLSLQVWKGEAETGGGAQAGEKPSTGVGSTGEEAKFSWFPAKARKQLFERMDRYAEASRSEFSVVLKYPGDPQVCALT